MGIFNALAGKIARTPDPDEARAQALRRALRPIKFRIYRQLAGLYFLKFRLELASAVIRSKRKAFRLLGQYCRGVHGGA